MTTNVTKLSLIEIQNLLLPIKEKCPYPINHQDIDGYQQDVRWLLKGQGITSMPDVYTCQVYLHLNIWDFTTWEEVYERYTKDNVENQLKFYPLMGREKCICGQDCLHRFKLQFNYRHMHVGCVCITKDIFFSIRFKLYKKKVKPIYVLNKKCYKYVMYQAFKRFKFNNSKKTLLKYRDKTVRRPLHNAFQKMKIKPIVKPATESYFKPIVNPIVNSIVISIVNVKPVDYKPVVKPVDIISKSYFKPIVKPVAKTVGMCGVCSSPCGKYPRCIPCEGEYKKGLPFTCKCGVKSNYKSCYKCKQNGISLIII